MEKAIAEETAPLETAALETVAGEKAAAMETVALVKNLTKEPAHRKAVPKHKHSSMQISPLLLPLSTLLLLSVKGFAAFSFIAAAKGKGAGTLTKENHPNS